MVAVKDLWGVVEIHGKVPLLMSIRVRDSLFPAIKVHLGPMKVACRDRANVQPSYLK
jgi:hypothetical protein